MKERSRPNKGASVRPFNLRKAAIFTIRRATKADLLPLATLFDAYRQFYEQPADLAGAEAFLTQRLEVEDSVLFVAEAAGKLLGFTQLYPCFSSTRMARIFILNDLFVAADARGQGVAAALISAAAAHGVNGGAIRLTLSTAHSNQAAQALYQREGWVRDDQFQSYNLSLV